MKTQVVIIGAGPAGLLLGQLLHLAGIETVIIERQSQEYVLSRIRAGVLEQGTVNLLHEAGLGARLAKEGLVHHGFDLAFGTQILNINLHQLLGKEVTVYGQTEVTKDLANARSAAHLTTIYSAENVSITGFDSNHPKVQYQLAGKTHEIDCDFIAGCDGYHGVCRASIPQNAIKEYERVYPFGWLGILADTKPVQEELIYGNHPDGFYLCSMRSPTRSRYYLQCTLDDHVNHWSDERFWQTLQSRLPENLQAALETGPSIEKSIAPLRSFVAEPLRFGRLFLAGDAGHIVPPTGAKGLNLAVSDVRYLSWALMEYYQEKNESGIQHYSQRALARIWKAERFSWSLTNLMHQFPDMSGFEKKMQIAEFDFLMSSESAQRAIAENYVGLAY
ncbi:4-hydroxybenzoate 3-monooxygenase [Polynucleobacter kasalickyi]|uniref:p-hydroxybenzoate 3-monooxygenase n=1 Tax=Polynucleobacter kasalickyi TaxID=1938817 RepID=A0A1W1Y381_9BURK|nr:4-hydroxybenzoate 3-monooxygenase [Polynucleobacter kasalickyi]SMC30680.1 p-hydroxybenzoate 3-monooxygenase [Polynucleobacter kasalickyi]